MSDRTSLYIVDGSRTPFCKFGSLLSDEPPSHLGIVPSKYILANTGVNPECIDDVIFGCCYQPPTTIGNIARTIGIRSGVREEVPAVTVHRNCASGFESITYAYDKAQAGKGDVFLVGGVESMSQAPFIFSQDATKKFTSLARSKTVTQKLQSLTKCRPSDFSPQISLKMAMVDNLCDMGMGQTAELLAREYNISREQQDEYAARSHEKALSSKEILREEIAPYHITEDNCIRSHTNKLVVDDNGPREGISMSKLSKLRNVFDRREGTVTAGNASQVTDGGAALLLMTQAGLSKTGCTPIAEICDYAYAGCDPKRMGLGPVHAIKKLDVNVPDMDLVEINEAFASQVLACQSYLNVPEDRLNVNGGAIALGHPLAASGTRLVLSLAKELKRRNLKNGLASLCVGGGQGGAIWIKTNI